jgi:hypothetical protein
LGDRNLRDRPQTLLNGVEEELLTWPFVIIPGQAQQTNPNGKEKVYGSIP